MSNERTLNAFPARVNEERVSGREAYTDPGMSLRDYFAARAMQSLVANGASLGSDQRTAEISYRIADAMISAREHV